MTGVLFVGDEDEGDRVGGMGGVRATGDGVDEHLGISVVSSDEERSATLLNCLIDGPQFGIDGFDSANGRLDLARVPGHVGVGEAMLGLGDLSMSAYKSRFHDGFLDGFLIRDPQVIIFLRTDGNEAFTLGL
jgi:hypothetical protein